MARDEIARERDQEASLLDRRSYLRLAGATAASVASFGSASATSSNDGALLYEDFASQDYADKFTSTWVQGEHDERVSLPTKSGSNSLCVDLPGGSHYGIAGTYDPVKAGDADSELTEMYASYWVRFSPDFQPPGNTSKLPGPANTEPGGGKGGEPSNGTNGWSARGGFTADGGQVAVGYYCYHMDMGGTYGDYFHAATVPRDQWVKIDQYIKLNTVSGGTANRDGQLKMWVDDQLKVDKSGMRFAEDLSLGCNYSFNVYYGGNDPSPKDQYVHIDSWAVSDSQRPDISGGDQQEQESVLDLVSESDTSTTDYEFTVEGNVRKRTDAGSVSAEGNDSITDNGDGTKTVTGASGDGYGDSYLVDGPIRSMSLDESKWTLRYDDQEVSVQDVVEPYGPAIDRFDIAKSEELGDDRMFSVRWAVSAVQKGLDTVEVVAVEGAANLNFAVTDVDGENASGWDLFQFPVGTDLDVNLRAKDVAGNVTKETTSLTL